MKLSTMLHQRFAIRHKARTYRAWRLGAVLALITGGAFAANCDMRLSNPEVDYGALNRGEMELRGNAPIALGTRQLTLTAVCRQETTFGLRFEGQRSDSTSYRFAGKGNFTIKLSSATLDGTSVQLAQLSGDAVGKATGASAAIELRPNEAVTAIAQNQRAVGKVFLAQIEIRTYISEAETRARDITTLEGRGALTLETQ
ncbi:hypothetical protein [Pseudomonas sp. AMR01]|uniref:hypothetical protein n=1 Tax=Pseudomonas sp. AMR01 TaxID=3064904 RepID=UPI0035BF2630